MDSVKLIENFYSFQGEGPDSGKSMLILRFKQCDRVENKNPCLWCDTLVKMRIQNEASYDILDIQKGIRERNCGILLTGGEPTFGENLHQTICLLNKLIYPIANVETNGFNLVELIRAVTDVSKNIKFVYSPKIFNTDDLNEAHKVLDLIQYDKRVYLKVVCDNTFLVENEFLSEISIDNSRVFLMPEGKTKEDIIKNAPHTFDLCEKYKFNFSSREHIIYDFV